MSGVSTHTDSVRKGAPEAPHGACSSLDSRRCSGSAGDAALSGKTTGADKRRRESIAAVVARMVAQGAREGEIAEAAGIGKRAVRRHRAKLRGAGLANPGRSRESRTNFGIPIPRWCPRYLREDYTRLARLYGEEIAARECRKLKAEAETYNPVGAH